MIKHILTIKGIAGEDIVIDLSQLTFVVVPSRFAAKAGAGILQFGPVQVQITQEAAEKVQRAMNKIYPDAVVEDEVPHKMIQG